MLDEASPNSIPTFLMQIDDYLRSDYLDMERFSKVISDLIINSLFTKLFPAIYQRFQGDLNDLKLYESTIKCLIQKDTHLMFQSIRSALQSVFDLNPALFLRVVPEIPEKIVDIFYILDIHFLRNRYKIDPNTFNAHFNLAREHYKQDNWLQLFFNILYLESIRESKFVCIHYEDIIGFISQHYVNILFFSQFFNPNSDFNIFSFINNQTELKLIGMFLAYFVIYKFTFHNQLQIAKLILFDEIKFKSTLFTIITDAEIISYSYKHGQNPSLISKLLFHKHITPKNVSNRLLTIKSWKAENEYALQRETQPMKQVILNDELQKSREIKYLKSKIRSLEATLKWTQKSLDDAIMNIQQLRDLGLESREEHRESIFDEMLRHKKEKFDYSSEYIDFSYMISAISPRAYNYLRAAGIPFPNIRTIDRHVSLKKVEIKKSLKQISQISNLINIYIGKSESKVEVSIAVDAFSIKPNEKQNYAFLYQCLPLSGNYHSFPFQLIPSVSGHATDSTLDTINSISEEIQRYNLFPRYVCTDGDSTYNDMHIQTFQKWYQEGLGFKENCLAGINYVKNTKLFPIADVLHLVKQFRNRLINNSITLHPERISIDDIITAPLINNILNLGPTLTDKSHTGKMKDAYPLRLFTIQNVILLIESNQVEKALYLLPCTLLLVAQMNSKIMQDSRRQLFEQSFEAFDCFFTHRKVQFHDLINFQKSDRTPIVYFAREIDLIRALNTIVGLAASLELGIDNLFLDRITTHPTENQIGLIRTTSQNQHSEERALSTLTKTAIINECGENIGITTGASTRVNVGGARANSKSCTIEAKLTSSFVSDCFSHHVFNHSFTPIHDILYELKGFEKLLGSVNSMPKINQGSPISSACIIQRIIAFNKDSKPKTEKGLNKGCKMLLQMLFNRFGNNATQASQYLPMMEMSLISSYLSEQESQSKFFDDLDSIDLNWFPDSYFDSDEMEQLIIPDDLITCRSKKMIKRRRFK